MARFKEILKGTFEFIVRKRGVFEWKCFNIILGSVWMETFDCRAVFVM